MAWDTIIPDEGDGRADSFLELGTSRLARDLFLLTAVAALFILMFTSSAFSITASRTWSREGRAVESPGAAGGMVLSIHLRRDGRIRIGDHVVATPGEAAAVAGGLLRRTPALRDARVILSTYRGTPSVRTSDVTAALAGAGLDPERFYLRFTEQ